MDTLFKRHAGAVTVTVGTEYDPDPDLSYYGKFTDDTSWDARTALYHRRSGLLRMPKSDLWRDSRGRICEAPESSIYAQEYQYIIPSADCENEAKSLRMAAERLDAYGRDQWSMIGIVATVTLDGAEIGQASCWGFEDDSEEKYLRSEARQIASEAIADARAWIGRRNHA